MNEIKEIIKTIENNWTCNGGGLTMAARDEIQFGQNLLADWEQGISRDFSWEEYVNMTPTSREMMGVYNWAFLNRFTEIAKTAHIVGLPSNCSRDDLENFLMNQCSLTFEFTRKGESIARCYWADEWNAETESYEIGGCISCLLDLENLKSLVVKAMDADEWAPSVPVSMIDYYKVNPDGTVEIYCDNGQSFSLGNDGYLYL